MSILIKGMDKPKSCDSCRCICSRWNGDETIWRCGLLVGEDYETTDRDELYKDCPLVEIPSAEPEIIRCKDCKYRGKMVCPFGIRRMPRDNDFCFYGKRREE